MIMCNILKISISVLKFPSFYLVQKIKNWLNYQDFTAVFVKYTNMEGFRRAGHIYIFKHKNIEYIAVSSLNYFYGSAEKNKYHYNLIPSVHTASTDM